MKHGFNPGLWLRNTQQFVKPPDSDIKKTAVTSKPEYHLSQQGKEHRPLRTFEAHAQTKQTKMCLSEYSPWNSQFKQQKSRGSCMCCICATTFLKTGSEGNRCSSPFLKPSPAPLSLARSKTDGGTQVSAHHWRSNCHCQGIIKKNPRSFSLKSHMMSSCTIQITGQQDMFLTEDVTAKHGNLK